MRSVLRTAKTRPCHLFPRILLLFPIIILFAAGSLAAATEEQETDQGYLGIHMRKITKELRKAYDLKAKEGVFVSFVEEDSPADEAGIKDGDVIVAFDGNTITTPQELKKKVHGTAPGQRIEVSIVRDGDERNLKVVIGEQPDEDRFYSFYRGDLPGSWDVPFIPHGDPRGMILTFGTGLGVKAVDLNEDLAPYFKVDEDDGVLVLDVLPESAAEEAGLKAGDVIMMIDKEAIASVDDLKEVVSDLDSGDEFKITIVREGRQEQLEAVAEYSSMWKRVGPGLRHYPGMVPPLWWLPKSFDDDLEDQMDGLREELDKLQEELDKLKEKI